MFFWNTQPRYVYVPARVVRRAPAPRYSMSSLMDRIIESELEDFFAPPPPPPQMFYIRYHYPCAKPKDEEKPQEKKEEEAPKQAMNEKEEAPKEQPKTEETSKVEEPKPEVTKNEEEEPKAEEPKKEEEEPINKEEPKTEEEPMKEEESKKEDEENHAEEEESESESMDEDEEYVSSRTSVYRGKGGLVHTVTEEQNGRTGKVVITEERRIGDRAMTLHRTLNADGSVEEEYETRDNLNDDAALEAFKNDWISLAPKKGRSLKQ